MLEDWRVEDGLFPQKAEVFCIASAGCTALALAETGRRVTAVDINPAQVEYVERRLAGDELRQGRAETWLRHLRAFLFLLGIPRSTLIRFLELDEPEAQLAMFDSQHRRLL